MTDLNKYKELWKDQETYQDKVDKNTLSRMIRGKSSSIVHWIFIISVIEFSLFLLLDIFSHPSLILPEDEKIKMRLFSRIISITGYGIMLYFMIRFYLNYKKIQVTLSIKELLHNIIQTRRSVRNYIVANITLMVIGTLTGAYILLQSDSYKDLIKQITLRFNVNGMLVAWSIVAFLVIITAGLLLLIYYLLYGLLIRRLMNNYKELIRGH
jgi:MFS family permease